MVFDFRNDDDYQWDSMIVSYHDLFSADSGFMESLEWWTNWHNIMINTEIIEDSEWLPWVDSEWWYDDCDVEYHYMIMWPMTAEQKIQYVLDNVVTSEE